MIIKGGMAGVNAELIAVIIATRPQTRRSALSWCSYFKAELGDSLLNLAALLDEIPDLASEPLPPQAEALREALVTFLAETPAQGYDWQEDDDG